MGKQVETKVEEIKVEGQQESQPTAQQVQEVVTEPKKKGILGSIGTVGKVVLGAVATAVIVVGGLLVKSLVGGKDEEAETVEETPDVSEPAEE